MVVDRMSCRRRVHLLTSFVNSVEWRQDIFCVPLSPDANYPTSYGCKDCASSERVRWCADMSRHCCRAELLSPTSSSNGTAVAVKVGIAVSSVARGVLDSAGRLDGLDGGRVSASASGGSSGQPEAPSSRRVLYTMVAASHDCASDEVSLREPAVLPRTRVSYPTPAVCSMRGRHR